MLRPFLRKARPFFVIAMLLAGAVVASCEETGPSPIGVHFDDAGEDSSEDAGDEASGEGGDEAGDGEAGSKEGGSDADADAGEDAPDGD